MEEETTGEAKSSSGSEVEFFQDYLPIKEYCQNCTFPLTNKKCEDCGYFKETEYPDFDKITQPCNKMNDMVDKNNVIKKKTGIGFDDRMCDHYENREGRNPTLLLI